LRKYYPKDLDFRILNTIATPSLLDILNLQIKTIGFREGLAMYVADYQEINGSLIVMFTLLIETIVAYKDLRGFAKIVEDDLRLVLSSSNLNTEISYDEVSIQRQSQNIEKPRVAIRLWLFLLILICLIASVTYSVYKDHKDSLFPEKLEITIHNETPTVLKFDKLFKDTSVIILVNPKK
jgi:hypothetical protein